MEKIVKPVTGLVGFLMVLVCIGGAIYFFVQVGDPNRDTWQVIAAVLLMVLSFFLMKGLMIIQPNHSRVLNFFGKYAGTVKENGWFFVNPFYTSYNISLRAQNLES